MTKTIKTLSMKLVLSFIPSKIKCKNIHLHWDNLSVKESLLYFFLTPSHVHVRPDCIIYDYTVYYNYETVE